ncbi:MAG: Unknown protein [uncultured Sulfurovum sp.]|uniref:Uncharacterized protein n=1 Tax=uncultured Sulfurovum sp. TaxID=269237 RepID=A0A6S6U4D2_9BACT|nr:MAG: Unknown protein [uncultured Sulfurovum sp.]
MKSRNFPEDYQMDMLFYNQINVDASKASYGTSSSITQPTNLNGL